MSSRSYRLHRLNSLSILVQWDLIPSCETLHFLLRCKKSLEDQLAVEVLHTYNELLIKSKVHFALERVRNVLATVATGNASLSYTPKTFLLPVCYDATFGLDLEVIAKQKNLTIPEIIKLHTSREYVVYFLGFLPGFPYLEGLDERLHINRKDTPRPLVFKGSVGLGGKQTGIYPQDSPGGWQLIGNCPAPLFDVGAEQPSPFRAGDLIKFYQISKQEHTSIFNKVQSGTYKLKYREG